ncbi:MAG: hypothetical protein U9N52_03495, partial [Campylobacterota bacterium]|nr:hypothetical protein [Campylobacterota bacterium]
MKIKILLPLLFSATFFVGCGNEVRPDTYVSQPSVLLTPYNISHLRLHVNSANSAVLTFDRSTFTYDSPHYQYSGTWSSSDTPTLISGGEEMAIVTSIEYTTDDGY